MLLISTYNVLFSELIILCSAGFPLSLWPFLHCFQNAGSYTGPLNIRVPRILVVGPFLTLYCLYKESNLCPQYQIYLCINEFQVSTSCHDILWHTYPDTHNYLLGKCLYLVKAPQTQHVKNWKHNIWFQPAMQLGPNFIVEDNDI